MASKYFTLSELAPAEYIANGTVTWDTFDPNLLKIIDLVREWCDKPLIINNYQWGGSRTLCGWRPQDCKVGAAKSAHKEGKAVDIICSSLSADDIRNIIYDHAHELPHGIRLELGVSWTHIDTRNNVGGITFFTA